MELPKDIVDKLGIKPFVASDYLNTTGVRRECLRVAAEEDDDVEFDKWLLYCYEGLLKQKGELESGQKLHR